MLRPDWDTYFYMMACLVAKRAPCLRRQCGAVIVKNKQVLSTGYNGPPRGIEHCDSRGCIREQLQIPHGERYEMCYSVHAEANAIIQAARNGVMIDGSDIYVTGFPCVMCTRMIINAGIKRVLCKVNTDIDRENQEKMFQEAGVELLYLEGIEN